MNNERPEEILVRLRRIQNQQHEHALMVLRRLGDGEKVSDGELVDAVFNFTGRVDLIPTNAMSNGAAEANSGKGRKTCSRLRLA